MTPDEAVNQILERVEPVSETLVRLDKAAGLVLRRHVRADRPSPAADVSAMDGYALRAADLSAGRLPVTGESLPGSQPRTLEPENAMRIFTGAGVPHGADVVIKREDVVEHDTSIDLPDDLGVPAGANIRRRGENMQAGDVVASPGEVLHEARIGALRAFGADDVFVSRDVRVGVITTGDEIVTEAPNDWQLRDSNGAAIEAWVQRMPGCMLARRDHAPDRLDDLTDLVRRHLDDVDLLLMTGGVSVGDHDHVRDALEARGVAPLFHGVAQRPGKPALGAVADNVPVIALPGNPVSVLVGLRRLVAPVLARLTGTSGAGPDAVVRLHAVDGRTLGLTWFRLVRLEGPAHARLVDTKGSGDLASSASSDGFVEIAPGDTGEGPLPLYRWT